ncbi:MAG TPA: tetratricopeptide repeat protein, partial [Thermoanaerobaculia bacterium]
MISLRPTLAATTLAAVLVTTWAAARPTVPAATDAAPASLAPPAAPRPGLPELSELSPAYAEAAAALRRRDCRAALAHIEPLTGTDAADPAFARVVSGLYAHACENVELARERLFLGGGRGTPLEDWRLLVLADSAAATGELPVARAAVEKILEGDDGSPLLFQALDAAVRRSWAAGDAERALELVERARRAEARLTGPWREAEETVTGLDLLAFEIATEAGREGARRTAVRRLVVRAPVLAREEGVSATLSDETGEVPWGRVLSPSELIERARRLLAAGEPQPAVTALQALPAAARDLDWHLLTARALTRAERGGEALALLSGLAPADPVRLARVEWARAAAVEEMATARRGRRNLPSERRQELMRQYREHLGRVARLGDAELAREALQEIFAELIGQERFEQGLEVLQALKGLDPTDETGAAFLWQRGWSAYQRRNWSGAIGYWAELAALYPGSRHHRSGHYWSGRAYEALGDRDRAARIYGDIAAADTNDFYRRYALARLGRPPLAEPAPPRLSWPTDPVLARARLLSDLGLDDLAATELAQVAERAEPRAVAALESLILARDGEPRRSIGRIRDAFPALGTPHQSGVPAEALRLYYPLA